MLPDGQYTKYERNQHGHQRYWKEARVLGPHRDQCVDRSRQYRRRNQVLRWPYDLRSYPGEEVDNDAARCRGDQANDDRADDTNAVIERLMRAENRKPRQSEGLEKG